MSIAIPFLAFLLVGAFAAYHRLRLAYWAAITATLLVGLLAAGRQPDRDDRGRGAGGADRGAAADPGASASR